MLKNFMPRFNEDMEADNHKKPSLALDGESHARICVALEGGSHMMVIGRCELNGLDRELWLVENETVLVLMRRALADLERVRLWNCRPDEQSDKLEVISEKCDGGQSGGESVKPTDETQIIPALPDPRGTPQARLMRLLFGAEYRNDTLQTLRFLAGSEFDWSGEWLKPEVLRASEFSADESLGIIRKYQEAGQGCPPSFDDTAPHWCEACKSYHVWPRSVFHHLALKCQAPYYYGQECPPSLIEPTEDAVQ